MRGDAEWNPGNFLEKKRSVRGTICEMHVHVIHAAAIKKLREVEGVARPQFCLCPGTIFAVVLLDELTRPFAASFSVALENP